MLLANRGVHMRAKATMLRANTYSSRNTQNGLLWLKRLQMCVMID